MARYAGKVGFADTAETSPGVWKDVIVERKLFGDVLRPSRSLEDGPRVNNDMSVGNSLSVVVNPDDQQNFWNIKYAWWRGQPWKVTKVTPDDGGARLILQLGEKYDGIKT